MNIKNLKSGLLFCIFYGFTVLVGCRPPQEDQRPNIVWLVTEDNSKHFLRLYTEGGAPMPAIESLATRGVVFDNAYSNAPVCSVARSTLISGCYAPRVGTHYHRRMQLAPMPDGLEMFPYYLRQAGYYTTNNSKEDYNFIKSDQVWDESSRHATFKNRRKGQPFFHVQNFGVTHEGNLHFSAKEMQKEIDSSAMDHFPYHPKTEIFDYTYDRFMLQHQKADTLIGKFINGLEEAGLLENTIIFYYGDHGGVLPRSKGYVYESGVHVPLVVYIPEKYQHLSPFHEGERTDVFVDFVDFAPTVLCLADIEIPAQIDGSPFLGRGISLDSLKENQTTFSYADRFDEKYDMVRAIRRGRWKYIRNYQPFNIDALFNYYRYKMLAYQEWRDLFREDKLNDIQKQFFISRSTEALYDLDKDPHEVDNLIDDPKYQSVVFALRDELKNKLKSMPDLGFYPESYFLAHGIDNPVSFGQQNNVEIANLIDIADLSLSPFEEVKNKIGQLLAGDEPLKKYWALIVCTTYGSEAVDFYSQARYLMNNDPDNLVKIRALEFLGLSGQPIAEDIIIDIVAASNSETEANLILNSIALLKTIRPDMAITIPASIFDPDWVARDRDLVSRRIEFINHYK